GLHNGPRGHPVSPGVVGGPAEERGATADDPPRGCGEGAPHGLRGGRGQRMQIPRGAVVKMLRMVCEEFGDNDWPDNLHQADVIEKHLIRPIRQDLQAQEAEIAALGEQVAALREELAKTAARHWTEAVEAEYLRLAARVALDVALGSKSWSLG